MERYCKYCSGKLGEEDKFCQTCGASVEESTQVTETTVVENNNTQFNNTQNNNVSGDVKTNGAAIGGFVCSLVGLLIAGIIMGIIAVSLGVAAKNHMKVFKNEKGNGLATAAIVIGIIDIAFAVLGTILKFSFLL